MRSDKARGTPADLESNDERVGLDWGGLDGCAQGRQKEERVMQSELMRKMNQK